MTQTIVRVLVDKHFVDLATDYVITLFEEAEACENASTKKMLRKEAKRISDEIMKYTRDNYYIPDLPWGMFFIRGWLTEEEVRYCERTYIPDKTAEEIAAASDK